MITKTCKKMKKPQKSKEASLSMDKFNQVFFHVSLKPRKMIKKKSHKDQKNLYCQWRNLIEFVLMHY